MLIVSFDDIIGAMSGAVDDRSLFYHTTRCGDIMMTVMVNFFFVICTFEGMLTSSTLCLEKCDWKWSALTESIYTWQFNAYRNFFQKQNNDPAICRYTCRHVMQSTEQQTGQQQVCVQITTQSDI